MKEAIIDHEIVATQGEKWPKRIGFERTRVVPHVVARVEAENRCIGRILGGPLRIGEQLLRGAVARHAEVDDLDVLAFQCGAALELALEHRPKRLVDRHLQCFGHRIAEHGNPHGVRRLRDRMLAIAQARAIDLDVRFAFIAKPSFRAGVEPASHCVIVYPEDGVAVANHAKSELGEREGDDQASGHKGRIDQSVFDAIGRHAAICR